MPPADFFAFFRASLDCIAAEEPQAHRALTRSMQGLRIRLAADGIVRTVSVDGMAWVIGPPAADVTVAVRFGRAVVMDLVDAETTLPDALDQERLCIQGPVDAVERYNDVLAIYLEALMRAPGASSLLEHYRGMN